MIDAVAANELPSGGSVSVLLGHDDVDDVVSAGTKINVFVNRLDGARTHA